MSVPQELPPSTTDPRPPSGIVAPEAPLSTNALLGQPTEIVQPEYDMAWIFKNLDPLYIDHFDVSINDTFGKTLYRYATPTPFTQTTNFDKGKLVTPSTLNWPLAKAAHARYISFDPIIIIKPVKIGDTPVFLDVFFRYQGVVATNEIPSTDDKAYHADHAEIEITNSEPIMIHIPTFWQISKVPNHIDERGKSKPPIYLPDTTMELRIKQPYRPTSLHPDRFECLVFLLPNLSLDSICTFNSYHAPWWMNA